MFTEKNQINPYEYNMITTPTIFHAEKDLALKQKNGIEAHGNYDPQFKTFKDRIIKFIIKKSLRKLD